MAKAQKYSCLTPEQQAAYEGLPDTHRLYVDYRGQGYNKAQAYRMCGYTSPNPTQCANTLERRNKIIPDLIRVICNARTLAQLMAGEGDASKRIDAIAAQEDAENALTKLNAPMTAESAKRLAFYRDIASGKTKTVKIKKKYDSKGELIEKTVEEVSDITTRISARKELDRILGLNSVVDVGAINVGDVTITIVDASKRDEIADARNRINLDADDVEIIDGEKCIVVDDDGGDNG